MPGARESLDACWHDAGKLHGIRTRALKGSELPHCARWLRDRRQRCRPYPTHAGIACLCPPGACQYSYTLSFVGGQAVLGGAMGEPAGQNSTEGREQRQNERRQGTRDMGRGAEPNNNSCDN